MRHLVPQSWKRALKLAWARLRGREVPLLTLHHRPAVATRRADDFCFNLPGRLAPWAANARWRLDDGPWRPLPQGEPRAPAPEFVVELEADDLTAGEHRITLAADAPGGGAETLEHVFVHDPVAPKLPQTIDWSDASSGSSDLEVEDGWWEIIEADGERRVRPRPGHEGYDRVVIAAGAFPGARRVETTVVFRRDTGYKEWGFGVLPLWGGRPDDPDVRPRRGWLFSIGWYFNRYRGVGSEFSWRHGTDPAAFGTAYLSLALEKDRPYRVVVECEPDTTTIGAAAGWRQRMKWWPADEAEPASWIEHADDVARPLPHRDYGVALVCYGCQAEFGPVAISDQGV